MPIRLTIALFDGAAKAGAAADRLAAMGVAHGAVRLIPQDGTSAAGVWDALAGLRLPDADRYGYAEAIRRGGVLLAVSAAERMDGEIVRALEEAGAVDLDERADEWWACGWRGYYSPMNMPDMPPEGIWRWDRQVYSWGISISPAQGPR